MRYAFECYTITMKKITAPLFLSISTFALCACNTVTAPPHQQDGIVVIELTEDAGGSRLLFSNAGTGSVLLGEFSGDVTLIDPFTYPFYETALFLHAEKGGSGYDVRVQHQTGGDGANMLLIERRKGDACAPWEHVGTVPVSGTPAAKLVGFGRSVSRPDLFHCDR